jgi:mono/diheme cytochrome c family protein
MDSTSPDQQASARWLKTIAAVNTACSRLAMARAGWPSMFTCSGRGMLLLLICLGFTCAASACAADDITYGTHVRKLLRRHCAGCHNTSRPRAGLDLSSYAGVMQGSSSGSVVTAGEPQDSLLYLSMTHQEEPIMPPGKDQLAEEITDVIHEWIAAGLPELPEDVAAARAKVAAQQQADSASGSQSVSQTASESPEAGDATATASDAQAAALVFRGGQLTAVTSLDVSPTGRLAAIGGQLQVLVFDLESDQLAQVLPFPEGEPTALRFSADGRLLIAGGGVAAESGKVVVWELDTWNRIKEFGDEFDVVLAADVSPDRTTAVLGGPERVVKVVDYVTGAVRATLRKHTDWVLQASFSPEGLIFVTSDRAGNVYVWESATAEGLHTLRGHRGSVTAVGWLPSGDQCLTAGEDGTVRVWDMHSGQQVRSWTAHEGGVLGMDVAASGELVTCGRDNKVSVWSTDGELQAETRLTTLPLRVAARPDGPIYVGAWSGEAFAWDVTTAQPRLALTVPETRLTTELAALDLDVVHPEMPVDLALPATADAERELAGVDMPTEAGLSKLNQSSLLEAIAATVKTAPSAAEQLREGQSHVAEAQQQLSRWQAVSGSRAGSDSTLNGDSLRIQRLTTVVAALEEAQAEAAELNSAGQSVQEAELLTRLALEKASAELQRLKQKHPRALAAAAAESQADLTAGVRTADLYHSDLLKSRFEQTAAAAEQKLGNAEASLALLARAMEAQMSFLKSAQSQLRSLQQELATARSRASELNSELPLTQKGSVSPEVTSSGR